MARGKKVFSPDDKIQIKSKLKDSCLSFWLEQGYKETSINDLCKKAEISTGAFYNLYSTKEELFFEVLLEAHTSINQWFLKQFDDNGGKASFERALVQLYHEYESKPFLYDVKTPDFTSFYNKLSTPMKQQLVVDSTDLFRKAMERAKLKLKVSETIALSALSVLLSSVACKVNVNLPIEFDYLAAFQFIAKQLVESIFE